MLQNYLKVSLRNFKKNPVTTGINIFGLAIGLAACLTLFQFVSFEKSYNQFHENSEHIYRISYSKEKEGIESFHTTLTYSGVGPLMKENFSEVLDFARLRPFRTITATAIVTYEEDVYEENRVYYTDPSFLSLFSYQLLEGDARTALNEQFTAVITESTAQKYFGDKAAMGKILEFGNDLRFTITGIIQDVPLNSHVKFDFLLSHSSLNAIMPDYWNDYNVTRFHGHLYVLMDPQTDMENFKAKLPQFVDEHVGGLELKKTNTVLKLNLMPLEDIHLYSHIEHEAEVNGDAKTVRYFSIIALLILFIAWVNYINLSTARAIERANEVGVRKVLGADRQQLIGQFLFESVMLNLFALLTAIGLVALAQLVFAQTGASQMLAAHIWTNTSFWMMIALLFFVGTIVSGFYPALVLSGFKPVEVLKGGRYKTGMGALLRKALVVFQFAASIALVIGTCIVYLQVFFLKNQDLGVQLNRAVIVQAPLLTDSTYLTKSRSFKSELLKSSAVQYVSATADIPGREFNSASWYKKINERDDNAQFCYRTSMDVDFIPAMGIELAAGRNFVLEDQSTATILNEAAARLFQFSSPEEAVGQDITFLESRIANRLNIVGVIKDYHHLSPKQEYAPVVINYSPTSSNYYVIKFYSGDKPLNTIQQILSLTEEKYRTLFAGNPFNYFFLDQEFEKLYQAERRFGNLFGLFSILAVIIALLGLLGLSAYTVVRRTKEIGIRKILGASVPQILLSLSKDFLTLILMANLIAWPVIYWLMKNWLEGFANRIPIYWWLFPLAGLLITLLALMTVSFHTVKAASANPVEALRYE
jgi:putative ABC transport system permease protein